MLLRNMSAKNGALFVGDEIVLFFFRIEIDDVVDSMSRKTMSLWGMCPVYRNAD